MPEIQALGPFGTLPARLNDMRALRRKLATPTRDLQLQVGPTHPCVTA